MLPSHIFFSLVFSSQATPVLRWRDGGGMNMEASVSAGVEMEVEVGAGVEAGVRAGVGVDGERMR